MKKEISGSLYRELIVKTVVFLVIPFLLAIIFLCWKVFTDSEKNYISGINFMAEQADALRGQHIESIYEIAYSISTNRSLTGFLLVDYTNQNLRYYSTHIRNIVSPDLLTNSLYVTKLYFVNETIPRGFNTFYHVNDIKSGKIAEFIDSDQQDMWITPADALLYQSIYTPFKDHYTYVKKVLSDGKLLYLLTVSVAQKDIDPFLYRSSEMPFALKNTVEKNGYLIANYTDIAIENNEGSMSFEEALRKIEAHDIIVRIIDIPFFPQRLALVFPANPLNIYLYAVLLLALIFVALLVRNVIRFIQKIFKSIYNCLESFEEGLENDFSNKLAVTGNDEISQIAQAFNKLIDRINDLLRITSEQSGLVKASQLKALQQQINPHFLYNTLEIFSYKMGIYGNKNEADAMIAFSNMLRYSMGKSQYVKLCDELSQVDNYLRIQKIKYDNIQFRADVEDGLHDLIVPRFILQPLIENSFSHGYYGEPLCIGLSFVTQGNYVKVEVFDNGKGLNAEELENINSLLATRQDSNNSGIGLSNINARMCLFYSDECRLRVSSLENQWTKVMFLIPKSFAGNNELANVIFREGI